MAFPQNSVLTSFTGANEDPLSEGGAWSPNTIRTASATRKPCARGGVGGNRVTRSTTASAVSESVYNTTFGADQEVYITVQRLGSSGQEMDLNLRITNEGTSSVRCIVLAYELSGGGSNWQFYWLNNTTYTAIGSSVSTQVISAGDAFGASVVGNVYEAWYKASGGSWVSQGTRTDSNVTGQGKIGLLITAGSNFEGDDFGGGTSAQVLLPDADITTTGWSTAPLFSKVNDSSDSTFITATAS